MSKRTSYPAEINHTSWPVDIACPLRRRWWGIEWCMTSMEREQMTELHFGCDPACRHREALLEDPYWLMRYERAQVEVSHHGIDGYGMGLYEKKD